MLLYTKRTFSANKDKVFCIQVYFEIPYSPYTRKMTFHKGRSELSLITSIIFRAGKKIIITVCLFFYFLNTTAVIFGWVLADCLLSSQIPGK